ncbi:spike base protein, RCAP_Rcc01079 family [Pseudotabrizicola algicola]|uniref:Uncharacterized protein n=1 Tax=Pseudotabrizicola algicola TaxID=2709381 RepID=A0A6B3RW25_9RHOB|nr:hypothetical protein [Pseudotabrizicola algicola]NEX47209.1 hypothetical protein [Pseudotabrizicola algicola]
MSNPFTLRTPSLTGPALDLLPVTPSNSADLSAVGIALYVQRAGAVCLRTVAGGTRTVAMGDHSFLPVGVTRVLAEGTTATGIHALVLS